MSRPTFLLPFTLSLACFVATPKTLLAQAGGPAFPVENPLTNGLPFAPSVIAADFDGDGWVDLAAASLRNGPIAWYRNQGNGTFSASIFVSGAASGPSSLAAADLDSDGRIDLLSASKLDNEIAWYRNTGVPGNGAFGNPASNQRIISRSAEWASSVAVGDLDGDGLLDVISGSQMDDKVAWYRNRGGGDFGWKAAQPAANQKVITTASLAPSCVAAGDLDGDGVVDLAVSSNDDNTLAWFKGTIAGNGTVSFTRHVISNDQSNAQAVTIADVNADGRSDLLCAASSSGKITYFRNLTHVPGAVAPFFAPEQVISIERDGASATAVGDLNRDGHVDIVSTSLLDHELAWQLSAGPDSTGGVSFGAEQLITSASQFPTSVVTADFDRDGAVDIATAWEVGGNVAVYLNRGVFEGGATLPPTLLAPGRGTMTTSPIAVAYTLPEEPLAGSVLLDFVSGGVSRRLVLAPSVRTFEFNPANPTASPGVQSASGSIPDGTYTITLSYRDAEGSLTASALPVTGVVIDASTPFLPGAATTVLAAQGTPVPGAGTAGSSVPAGAIFRTFGIPAINNAGDLAMTANYSSGAATGEVVLGPGGAVLAGSGQDAPDGAGVPQGGLQFASFDDVLLNESGTVAFTAMLRGNGVNSQNDKGIWTNAGGGLRLIARKGSAPLGLTAKFKTFQSVALSAAFAREEGGPIHTNVAFVAQLQGSGVRAGNDHGLWIYENGTLRLALLEDRALALRGGTPKRVKSFVALAAPNGAAGHGGGAAPAGVLARVLFANGSQALVRFAGDGGVETVETESDDLSGTNASVASFGVPVQNVEGDSAFVATLRGTRNNSAVLFAENGFVPALAVREGDRAAGVQGATFSGFKCAVLNEDQRIAFIARLTGRGVDGAHDESIWVLDPAAGSTPTLVARQGTRAAGAPAGAQWKTFKSMVLPDGARGPIFLADLAVPPAGRPNPAQVNHRNDTGVWAVDSAGELRLIVREGDTFPGTEQTIRSLTLLGTVLGSPAQARSFNGNGELVYRATLDNATQVIAKAQVP